MGGTNIYYSPEWREVLVRSYGYTPYYLEHRTSSGTISLLPMMLVNQPVFRRKALISLPFSDEVGPNASNSAELEPLLEQLKEIRKKTGATYVEIKGCPDEHIEYMRDTGFISPYQNVRPFLRLNAPMEVIEKSFQRRRKEKLKAQIKKGARVEIDPTDKVEKYHHIHCRAMKRLGTPPHSRRFFQALADVLKDDVHFFLVPHRGVMIGGVIGIYDRSVQTARYYAGASLPGHDAMSPQTVALYELIRHANMQGMKKLEFGVSRPGSGVLQSKMKWTRETPEKVNYLYGGGVKAVDPREGTMTLFSRIWKNMVPASIANRIGPVIRGQLGK